MSEGKMQKLKFKILLILLIAVICSLYAEEVLAEGDFDYTVENGKATIVEYIEQTRGAYGDVEYENLIIPEKLGAYEITSIGNYAFLDCYSVTMIEIPNSVMSIGDYAFYSCTGLTTIEIPDSVTSIGNYVFFDCYSLTTIKIPDTVTRIGKDIFLNCDTITLFISEDSYTHKYALKNDHNFVLEKPLLHG